MFPTYGLVAGYCNQTLLLDVGFGGGAAASGVESSVIDAQHHSVAQTLTTGHRALVVTGQTVVVSVYPAQLLWSHLSTCSL